MRPSRDFLNSSVFCFHSSAFKQIKQIQSRLKIWLSPLSVIIFQIILPWNYLALGFLLVLTLGPAAHVYSFSRRPRPQTQRNPGAHRAASIQRAGVAPPFPSEGRSDRRRATRNTRTTDRTRGGASQANTSGRAAPPHAREPEARRKPGGAALPPPTLRAQAGCRRGAWRHSTGGVHPAPYRCLGFRSRGRRRALFVTCASRDAVPGR